MGYAMYFWLVSLGLGVQILGGILKILAVALNNIAIDIMTECHTIGIHTAIQHIILQREKV